MTVVVNIIIEKLEMLNVECIDMGKKLLTRRGFCGIIQMHINT